MTVAGDVLTNVTQPSQCDVSSVPIYCVDGWSASSYYQTATPGGEPGSTAFAVSVLARFDTLVGTGTLFSRMSTASTAGWEILCASGSVNARWYDGGAALRTSPTFTVTSGMLGKWLLLTAWLEAGNGHLAANGVEVGTAVTFTGFNAFSSRTYIGRRQSASSPTPVGVKIAGVAGASGAMTAAEVAAHYERVRLFKLMQPLTGAAMTPSVTTDLRAAFNGLVPTTLANYSSPSDTFTLQGSLSLTVDRGPDS